MHTLLEVVVAEKSVIKILTVLLPDSLAICIFCIIARASDGAVYKDTCVVSNG